MATLEIEVAAETDITIQGRNQTIKQSKGPTKLSLEEGEYQVTAHGPGHVDTVATVALEGGETKKINLLSSKNGMELWPQGWSQNGGWFQRRGGGFVLYDKPGLSGIVEFTAKLHRSHNPFGGGPHLKWVVNFLDDRNYILFQMDGKYFYRTEVIDGNRNAPQKIQHHIPDHSDFVNLQIQIQPGRVENRWSVNGGDWKILDDFGMSTAPSLFKGKVQSFNEGRFGFYLPGHDEVEISNFSHYAPGR